MDLLSIPTGAYPLLFEHRPAGIQLSQAAAARDAFLKDAGHTTQGSRALRICEDNAFVSAVQDGEALASVLEEQR